MDRPQIEVDLEIQQQQRQLREQEEQQRIAEKLPQATEDVQQKLQQDNPLKDYSPEQQKQLTDALAIEVARSPTGQKIDGSLMAFLDKGTPVHVDIQKVLAQHQPELPDGQQKSIEPERQKQIDELLDLFNVDNKLKDHFSPKQQELLKEAMAKQLYEHAGDPPKLMILSYDDKKQDFYFVTQSNQHQHIHPNQYLAQFKEELQAERPPLFEGRKQAINQLMSTHSVASQFKEHYSKEHYQALYDAIGNGIHRHTGTPPSVNSIQIDENQIKIALSDGYQLKIDTQAVLEGELSFKDCTQKERIPVIAQRDETGESLGRKLDPQNPKAAYGYLLATEQVKLIKGDDGHAIPQH